MQLTYLGVTFTGEQRHRHRLEAAICHPGGAGTALQLAGQASSLAARLPDALWGTAVGKPDRVVQHTTSIPCWTRSPRPTRAWQPCAWLRKSSASCLSPVKVEAGERPLKDSGFAITIDGAFSEVYGDRGYTLILTHDGTRLAEPSHFESVLEALSQGADIIPKSQRIRRFDQPRRVADTERGDTIRGEIAMLTRLVEAYEANVLHEQRQ